MANETREKILTTTSHLLEQQGYHATGLNQIVKESGTPRGSLYYYFPDGKEELAAEAVQRRMADMSRLSRQKLSEIEDPIEAIHNLMLFMAEQMASRGCSTGAPIAAVALEASNSSERIREACAAGYQSLQDVMAAKLVMGAFPGQQAAQLAMTINASIEGAMILSRTQQNPQVLVQAANDIKLLLQTAQGSTP